MVVWVSQHVYLLIGVAVVLFEIVGITMAIDAIMKNRTSQGAIAWAYRHISPLRRAKHYHATRLR